MKNVQVTIDQRTLTLVDQVAKPLGLKRSEIVRRALREWLRRHAVERFEEDWITAARKDTRKRNPADAWLAAQAWSGK